MVTWGNGAQWQSAKSHVCQCDRGSHSGTAIRKQVTWSERERCAWAVHVSARLTAGWSLLPARRERPEAPAPRLRSPSKWWLDSGACGMLTPWKRRHAHGQGAPLQPVPHAEPPTRTRCADGSRGAEEDLRPRLLRVKPETACASGVLRGPASGRWNRAHCWKAGWVDVQGALVRVPQRKFQVVSVCPHPLLARVPQVSRDPACRVLCRCGALVPQWAVNRIRPQPSQRVD